MGAIANQANRSGAVTLSSWLIDCCWGFLNCAKAIALGAKDGVINTVDACLHPLDTAKDLARGIVETARTIAYLGKELGLFLYYAAVDQEALSEKIFDYREKLLLWKMH